MATLNETPRADGLHIGFFGKRNAGKSTLVNLITGQEISIVSDVAGTTTDVVYKSIEISGLGPCEIMDTAGFDDVGGLGEIRVEKTKKAAEKANIAVIAIADDEMSEEIKWYNFFKEKKTPVLIVITKTDVCENLEEIRNKIAEFYKEKPLEINQSDKDATEKFRQALTRLLPENFDDKSILGSLVKEDDTVLLVMPQDIQAPKGRLILPQVQTIRELLDRKCTVICTTTDKMTVSLSKLAKAPELIITDSQVFKTVYENKPEDSRLTSFSVLFAGYKGDIEYYTKSVVAIDRLTENSKVLIAECCTHAPLSEDIGRVKIPNMLRKKVGEGLTVDMVAGSDFPEDLTQYDLIIQCGACMFNRKYVLSRIERAKKQGVPMTNYGVVIAYLTRILDKIDY